MKKNFLLVLTFFILWACTDDDVLVNTEVERDAGFEVRPYPVITVNAGKSVEMVVVPGEDADEVRIAGRFSSSPEIAVLSIVVKDTLSPDDLIPGDGVYRTVISSLLFPVGDDLSLEATAYREGEPVWRDSLNGISVVAGNPPVISGITAADTLKADETTWPWTLTAVDGDANDTLSVRVEVVLPAGALPLGKWRYDSVTPEGLFTFDKIFSNETRVGLKGETLFRFIVEDLAGLADSTSKSIWVENLAPQILDVDFPDTLIANDDGSTSAYRISVSDPETLADVDSVVLLVYRPDGTGVGSNPITGFHDDGRDEDEIAGDGWYFLRIYDPGTGSQTGEWTLRVYATDKTGNRSEIKNYPLIIRNP